MTKISIHAPLTGSDVEDGDKCATNYLISIHAPLTGSDFFANQFPDPLMLFQSTLPLRGATILRKNSHFGNAISIHAPLTGSDHRNRTCC